MVEYGHIAGPLLLKSLKCLQIQISILQIMKFCLKHVSFIVVYRSAAIAWRLTAKMKLILTTSQSINISIIIIA